MSIYLQNVIAIVAFLLVMLWLAGSLLWRVGQWGESRVRTLIEDHGIPVGRSAPELAAYYGPEGRSEAHLTFEGRTTLLVFGAPGCQPCREFLGLAPWHIATRYWRLVYVSGHADERLTDCDTIDDQSIGKWEVYRFHDEASARDHWNAPVSPYYHVINPDGVVVAKGIGNKPEHLDHLLTLHPHVHLLPLGPGGQ